MSGRVARRSHTLDAARLKVARADEHIRELDREICAYLATRRDEVVQEAQGGVLHAHVPSALHLSAIAGDSVYNLRASLDLVFWALALQTGPKDPDRERLSFPIFANESKFRAAQEGFARYVPLPAVHVIEAVQPFRTRNRALSVLRTLSNQDRHGLLALTAPDSEGAIVALEGATMPPGSVTAVLQTILRHISTDVLPQFEPFCP